MVNITRRTNPTEYVGQLSRMFDDAFRSWPWSALGSQDMLTGNWIPVDVTEDTDEVRICAELPGVKPEDVKISLENNLLTIRGEKQQREEETSGRAHRYERSYGMFERSFTVPSSVDAERITATYENGVLELTLPKAERAKPRQISIQAQAGPKQKRIIEGQAQKTEHQAAEKTQR